jgi:hypothetical protein
MGRSLSALRVELAGRIVFERQNLEMAVGALGFPEQGRGREEKSLPGVRAQVVAEMGVILPALQMAFPILLFIGPAHR